MFDTIASGDQRVIAYSYHLFFVFFFTGSLVFQIGVIIEIIKVLHNIHMNKDSIIILIFLFKTSISLLCRE